MIKLNSFVINANDGGTEDPIDMEIVNDGTGDETFGNYEVTAEVSGKTYTFTLRHHYRPSGMVSLIGRAFDKLEFLVGFEKDDPL